MRADLQAGERVYTNMELWEKVRRAVIVDKRSKRSVCREFGIHWSAMEKMLEHAEPQPHGRSPTRPKPVLGPYLGLIDEMLEVDKTAPKKQRHTAKRIYDRLCDEHGYTGCETIVRRYVAKKRVRSREVFVPVAHPPGEAQFDFGYSDAKIAGTQRQVAYAVMSLPYSDAFFVKIYPREVTEAFLDAHVRAFEFFGGVPTRIAYDNTKLAVARVVGGHGREVTREFRRLRSHHLFESHFCNVGRGNEKGHVEGLVKYSRANFMVPVPELRTFAELNAHLEAACKKELLRTVRGKPTGKAARLEEDRAEFLEMPKEVFSPRRVMPVKSNSISLIRFDKNDYSVPTKYAHHDLTVSASVDDVEVSLGDEVIATHTRRWGREEIYFEPIHYLALLERKPGALDYAKPLCGWDLPEPFSVLRARLEAEWGPSGTREYIKVLRLLERHSPARLRRAVERALDVGAITSDAIALIAAHAAEDPVGLFSLDGRPHLKAVRIAPLDLTRYRALTDGRTS